MWSQSPLAWVMGVSETQAGYSPASFKIPSSTIQQFLKMKFTSLMGLQRISLEETGKFYNGFKELFKCQYLGSLKASHFLSCVTKEPLLFNRYSLNIEIDNDISIDIGCLPISIGGVVTAY